MVKDRVFLQTYSSGEDVTGPLGFEKFTIGDVTVDKLELGLVTTARNWGSQHSGHGVLGLAGPDATFAFDGQADPADKFTNNGTRIPYDPVVTTIFKNATIPPVFSLALDRKLGSSTGVLAFGGLANVSVQGGFAKSPMVDWRYQTLVFKDFYVITPAAVRMGSTMDSATSMPAKFPIAMDSGSLVTFVPDGMYPKLLDLTQTSYSS